MVNQNWRTITARDLLYGFLELRRLTPDMTNWSEERLSDNPPRLYRLRKLIALFRAFEIDWDPTSFVKGRFIQPESPRYAALVDMMMSEMPAARRQDFGVDYRQLPDCFEILLRYRECVGDVLAFSSGLLEADGLYLYAHRKAGELNQIIQENIPIVEDILAALVSPEAKSFPLDQMARDYGYPDVDLSEIDEVWQ